MPALRLLACCLLAFWAAFLLLPIAGVGGLHAGRAGTAALALAAVVVPLGYLILAAARRGRPPTPAATLLGPRPDAGAARGRPLRRDPALPAPRPHR